MSKEELKQESEVYFKSICGDYNEEYERTGKRHYWVGFDIKNAYLASAEPREIQLQEKDNNIAELEKENAELRAFKEKCKFNVSDICKEIEIENNLTKAKELIKTLLLIADNKVSQMEFQLCVADAKQFLEENK